MKIDVYAHIIPPKVKDFLWDSKNPVNEDARRKIGPYTALYDLNERFKIMDKFSDRREVLTLAWYAVDDIAVDACEAADLAERFNNEMAELVLKYPDRFLGAAAVLPLRNIDAALRELDRAINQLHLNGVLIRTPIDGKPIDSPEYLPLFEKMCRYDLPIWLHPARSREFTDYPAEKESKYDLFRTFGLPYETTAAMSHLVFSGILQQFPSLKIITHHCGGMVPYFAQRIVAHYYMADTLLKHNFSEHLKKPLIDYFRQFYNDTAIVGNTPALMCAYQFFGSGRLLFGSDFPMDAEHGEYGIRNTVEAIEHMDIPDGDKKKIFEDNARDLLRLPA